MTGVRFRWVQLVVTVFIGFLSVPQAGAAVTLLDEGFENVTGVGGDTERTVQEILNNTPQQLVPGTTYVAPVNVDEAVNVRAADNWINANPTIGFNPPSGTPFFNSNFLALGIGLGGVSIGTAFPNRGTFGIDLPLLHSVPDNANYLQFSFDYALEGNIHALSFQRFEVFLDDDTFGGNSLFVVNSHTGFGGDALGGVYAHHSGVIDLSAIAFTPTRVRIRLTDGGQNFATNWAGGVDNVRVIASENAVFSVPEPGTLTLLCLGLALAGLRIRSRSHANADGGSTG